MENTKECTTCGLLKSTCDATGKECLPNMKGHNFKENTKEELIANSNQIGSSLEVGNSKEESWEEDIWLAKVVSKTAVSGYEITYDPYYLINLIHSLLSKEKSRIREEIKKMKKTREFSMWIGADPQPEIGAYNQALEDVDEILK